MPQRQPPSVEHSIDHAVLTPLVQAAMDCPTLQIEEWQRTSLSVQGRRTVFRFAGIGHDGLTARPWSIILKELKAPDRHAAADMAMDYWCYWPRESLLYAAGVLQDLSGGLRAPRCFGVVEPTPHLRWIWLEDLQDQYQGQWPLERFALAAYHLGQFNGSYLAGKPMPLAPWLTDKGLRSQSATRVAGLERFRDPALWRHPIVHRAFSTPILHELERLATDRERFLAGATHLPVTFCHLDAWHGNMAAVEGANGEDVTVLFDWALAGYGAPGQEISNMIWTSLLEGKVEIQYAEQLEAMVMERYLQGLSAAGWRADPQEVRYAYLMSSVLNFGLEPEAVDHALNEDPADLEQRFGWPVERVVEQTAQVTYLLFERANDLRTLCNG